MDDDHSRSDRSLLEHLARQVQGLDDKVEDARASVETLARAQVAIEGKLDGVSKACAELHSHLLSDQGLLRAVIRHEGRLDRVEGDVRHHLEAHERGDFQEKVNRFDLLKVMAGALGGGVLAEVIHRLAAR